MRLGFPNGESHDRILQSGELRIGSAADNDIVLSAPGVEAHHAALTVDTRGAILWILTASGGAYVNARPVRERAMVRLGDLVTLGEARFILKPDSDQQVLPGNGEALPDLDPDEQARQAGAPGRAVLRGISGTLCGQGIPVRNRVLIGAGPECGVRIEGEGVPEQAWAVESDGRRLLLRSLDPASRAELNGVPIRDAALHPGDQVAFGQARFLVEAPGLLKRGPAAAHAQHDMPNVTQTMRAVGSEDAAVAGGRTESGSSLNVWLLIGAALLIAAVIAVLLFVEF